MERNYFAAGKELRDAASVGGNTGPNFSAFFRDGPGYGGAFHLALVVDDHAGVVLEVDEHAVLPPERFALSDNHSLHDCR